MKFNIELPFFPGFYESDLENSDTSYWAIKEELEYYQNDYAYDNPDEQAIYTQLTKDDLEFDYAEYEKDVRDAWVKSFRSRVPEFVLSVEDVEMTSPKYYNFETDRVWADVELRDDWMDAVREFMVENADWLRDRIKEDWTSYDGFWSFVPNNVDKFEYEYYNKGERHKDMLIDIMLEWYFLEYIDFYDVLNDTLEEDYMRIYSHVALQSEEDWSLWDFEYDDKTNSFIPTHKLETA
jgi:hypothetical protein